MSIPGGSSNPYQQPPGGPQPQPPYAAAGPAGYGPPQGPAGFGPLLPPQAGPPPRGRMPGWLLGVGGVLVASAGWGGVLFATGAIGSDDSADLAGYRFEDDLCGTADMAAFEGDYRPYGSDEPVSQAARSEALDVSMCEFTLEPAGVGSEDFYNVYMTYELSWHKGVDPAPEFAARAEAYEQYNEADGYYDYRTEPLAGLGEEAFIIFGEDTLSGELSWASVTVRDGWFEYALTWNAYLGDDPDGLSEHDRVRDMLRSATEETLTSLRSGNAGGDGDDGGQDGTGGSGDSGGSDDDGTGGSGGTGGIGGPRGGGEPEAV